MTAHSTVKQQASLPSSSAADERFNTPSGRKDFWRATF